jgi:TolA-binding protein
MSPDVNIPHANAATAVALAFGAGAGALGKMLAGNRRTDRVDAVTAVAAAFDRVAEATNRHVADLSANCQRLQNEVDFLRHELRKRDEMIFTYLGDPVQRTAAAEIAAEKLTHAAATAAASVLSTAAHAATHPGKTSGRRTGDTPTTIEPNPKDTTDD